MHHDNRPSPMTAPQFNDRNIQWRELAGFKHMLVSVVLYK